MPVGKRSRPCVRPFRLGGLPVPDLGHDRRIHRIQYARGRMDGFVRAASVDRQTVDRSVMGYYDDRDLPFYWNVADEYVLFDRFFAATTDGSVASHMFWVTGTPGDPDGGFGDRATIFDRLDRRGISWKFYVEDYDPRQPTAGGAGAAPQLGSLRRRSEALRPHRGPRRVLRGPARRTAAPGRVHRARRLERASAGPDRGRGGARQAADHRPVDEQRLGQLGVHVDLRRLGRMVRPRAAAEGRRRHAGISGAGPAREPLRAPRPRRQHPARHHLDPPVHRGQLGARAARAGETLEPTASPARSTSRGRPARRASSPPSAAPRTRPRSVAG